MDHDVPIDKPKSELQLQAEKLEREMDEIDADDDFLSPSKVE